jgi:hypothetical protein
MFWQGALPHKFVNFKMKNEECHYYAFHKLVGKFLLEKQHWEARFRKARKNEALLLKGQQFGIKGYQGVIYKS